MYINGGYSGYGMHSFQLLLLTPGNSVCSIQQVHLSLHTSSGAHNKKFNNTEYSARSYVTALSKLTLYLVGNAKYMSLLALFFVCWHAGYVHPSRKGLPVGHSLRFFI